MSVIYLGLGSNLGNREKNIRDAVKMLAEKDVKTICLSSLIETPPVGGPLQGLFLNAVLKAECSHSPFDLLDICQGIEKTLGRVRTVMNGPRTIDIDILLFDDLRIDSTGLTIPHPRMRERDFVMIPLREITPSFF